MYIAIDNGGTTTRIGIMRNLESATPEIIARFPTEESYERQLVKVIEAIGRVSRRQLHGIGISFGAQVSRDGQYVFDAANLRDYERKPLVRQLSGQFRCPVRLAHDAVCGLLAEKAFGMLTPFDRCAYLTVSTGTGAAVHLKKGNAVLCMSIEMGHQIIADNSRKCLCGQVGCLETITGGRQMGQGRGAVAIDDLSFWKRFVDCLSVGIVNLSWLTRIDAVAVSGGIALNAPYVRDNLARRVGELRVGEPFQVLYSRLGEIAPLVGSALLATVDEDAVLH